ncbi:MAG: hypothetical protein J6X85_03120, partial [Ruminococcus sp.]|nr:hypothetical protein [Ruminococcus sp.]
MSTLDDLVKKYGSSSTPAKKKKNTSTTGLDGLYNKLGLETPEYSYSNPYESDPYALAVDEAYNRVNNNNLLTSNEDRRQLSAREKYAQRDNESNRQRNSYSLELPKPTAQKDTSRIGDLEDSLIEQKKYGKESKQKKESLSNSWKPYATETRDERDARVRQRYKDEQRIRELEDILAGNSHIEQPKSVNDVGALEDSLIQNKKYGAPIEIAEQPKSIDLERERAIEYTNAGNELYDLKQKIAKEDAQIEERNRLKKMEQYYDLLNNSDFQQKSAYSPTGGKADNPMAKIRGYQDYAFDFILYDAINGNRDAYDALRYVNSPAYQPEWADYNSEQTQELTESEKRIFNYIYKTQGKKAATEYYNLLQPELEKRAAETELNKWRQEARQAPVGAAIASALMAPARALEYPLQLIDYAATGKINQYSPNSSASRIRNAVSETITEGWGKVGSFAYQTGMSMVDFLINLGMGAAIGGGVGALGENATLLLMGSAAAADETVAKKQAGYDDKRAFILGAIAGAAETVTERIGFDALFKTDILKNGAKGFASYLLRNAASEGAEEGLSDIINGFADDMYDAFASQSESEWKRTIRALKEAHPDYSDSRLFGIALAQRAEELGLDIAGGMVSGIAMAGGMSAINAIGNDIGTRNTGKEIRAVGDDVVQSAIAEGLERKPDTQSYKLATALNEKLQRGEQLTNKEIGQLYQANVEAINAENAETDAKKLQLPTVEERSTAQSAARNNQNLYLQEEAQRNILEARQTAQTSENVSDAESNATLATQENATETRTAPESIAETKRLQLPTVKENNNVRGENDLRNGSERHNGENTSQQVRAVEESAGRNPRRQTLGYAKDVGISNLKTEGKAVSTYEMTGSGSKTDAHYLITGGETESLKRARAMSEAAGYKLVPYIGDNLHTLNSATNKESSDRAMIDLKNKVIYARADHPHFVIDQLVRHELGHDIVKQGKINVAQVVKQMQSIIKDRAAMKRSLDWLLSEYRQRYNSDDAYKNTGDAYADAYAGSGMTNEEIWEEIVCDALGDMNAFAGDRTMTDSTRGIVDQYLAEIKNQAEAQQTRAPPGELSQDVINDIQHDRPIDTADEVKASREFDSKYQEKAEKKNKSLGFVAEDIMVKAGKQRAQVKEWLDAIADKLPPDVLGNTWITDQSYGGTEELTTVCIRSIGAHMLMDAIADKLGRPLNVIETTRISQAIFDYTDKPECLYCYVAMDRKAYREYLGSYIEERDAFIKDIKDGKPAGIKSGKVDPDSAYGRFLGDRKNTSNMQDRAKLWLNTYNSGAEFITAKDLANTENLMSAAERNSNAEKQV